LQKISEAAIMWVGTLLFQAGYSDSKENSVSCRNLLLVNEGGLRCEKVEEPSPLAAWGLQV